jgi:hypothetical protein
MDELSAFARISLYVLLALIGMMVLIIGGWQAMVFRGRAMENADGSKDDWHEQKIFYGMALADLVLACPASITGIILVFLSPRWGIYLLALTSFWLVWANTMTTATSLRFEKPRISLYWFITFPFGAIVGMAFIVWTFMNFEKVYF